MNAGIDTTASDWIVRCDAGLTAAERAKLEAWRAADPRHAAALDWHERAWTALDRPRRAGQAGPMLERFAATTARRRRRRIVATTAGLALFLIGGFVWQASQSPPAEDAAVPPTNALVVQPKRQTLPDGSVVELRSGARIAVDFGAARRRVSLLEGEAHFNVAKHQERPFVVVAGGVEVRAVGTAFAVELEAMQVGVLVTEGEVSVVARAFAAADSNLALPAAGGAGARIAARPQLLTARQRISVPLSSDPELPAPRVLDLAESELAERLTWRSVRLEFTDTPLVEAIALMNRHSPGPQKLRFIIDDPVLARAPVTGLFRADNSETFVRLLEASFGLRAERSGATVTLRRKH